MAKPKFYAVRVGRKPGVYNTWDECKTQVDGYPKAAFKSFNSAAEAKSFMGAANSARVPEPGRASAVKRGGPVIEGDILKRRKSTDNETVAPPRAFTPPQMALLRQQQPLKHSQQRQLTSAANTAAPPGTNLQSPEQQEVIIYFDGGSRSNPGRAGYGYVILDSSTSEQLRLGCRAIKYGSTNNQAEYTGMVEGMKYAIDRLGARRLIVRGDSELVVRQMTGVYRVNSEKLRPLYESAQQLASRCSSFTIEHVYRDDNQMADKLSNLAMDMDRALDDIVAMWQRGETGRAVLVQKFARAADVVADQDAVNMLGQSPSFLGAVAELVSQMWDLPEQEAVELLQAKGWTEATGGPPLGSTQVGSSSDSAATRQEVSDRSSPAGQMDRCSGSSSSV